MTAIRALVVGIDRYDYPGWNVSGPVVAAQSVVHWLLGLQNVELDLDVFLSDRVELDNSLEEEPLRSRFRLHRATTSVELNTLARKTLPGDAVGGTQLFVFWSGHGVTCGASTDRILMCEDFDETLQDRFFNGSDFIRMLRTQKYSVFESQLMLVDACGNFQSEHEFHPKKHVQQQTRQLTYFASQDGSYTKSATAGGMFTATALHVLKDFGSYPTDLDELDSRLHAAYLALESEPFCIASRSNKRERTDFVVGSPDKNPAVLRFFNSAIRLLADLDIRKTTCRRHYERTVADFGMPAVSPADDVPGMLMDLCHMGNRLSPGDMSEALMQFMERLAELPELAEPVIAWLAREAPSRKNSRDAIREKLALERMSKTLLILVRDINGEIAAMRPYLCLSDGSFDQTLQFEEVACMGWTAFVLAVQTVLGQLMVDGMLPNLQIQFAVDPILLDRPFHQIEVMPGGPDLGSEVPVVLRHRTRLQTIDQPWRKLWKEYTDVLRSKDPKDLKWVRIGATETFPREKGMCFAGFTLPHPVASTASSNSEKQVLGRLLRAGAPVVYVRHTDPNNGQWQEVETALKTMSGEPTHFGAFVRTFYQERLSGNLDASQATLLWDDPEFNPFS